MSENRNLDTILASTESLSTFREYLENLSSISTEFLAGNITILAPSNNAFADGSNAIQTAGNNTKQMEAVLNYHALNGLIPVAAFTDAAEFLPTSLTDNFYSNVTGGQRLMAKAGNDTVDFYSAIKAKSTITTGDIFYSGGLIHIIDRVLTPPTSDFNTITDAKLQNFVNILNDGDFLAPENIGFVNDIESSSDVTLFAVNGAQYDSNWNGLANATSDQKEQLFKYHCVGGIVAYSNLLQNGTTLTTLQGENVTIRKIGQDTYVNAARVLEFDYLTSNGVMHVLEDVLDPAHPNATPTISDSNKTPSTTSTSNTTTSIVGGGDSKSGLTTSTKTGVIVGVVLGVISLIILALLVLRLKQSRRKKQAKADATTVKTNYIPYHLETPLDQMGPYELPSESVKVRSEMHGQLDRPELPESRLPG